jgi:flagellar operon protein
MDLRELSSRVHREVPPLSDARPPVRQITPAERSTDFGKTLEAARQNLEQGEDGIRLSAHAAQRIQERSISLTREIRRELSDAMNILQEKGARDALIIRQDAAFVVNIPNRVLVTAIPQHDLQQRVFTQIDSTMLI